MKRPGSAAGQKNKLFENALDYLDRSIEDIGQHPKFAVASFSTAVELVLKARLLEEHWTLILKHPGGCTRAAFKAGDFHSVSMDEAIGRLENVAGVSFSKAERSAYAAVRKRRNMVTHFHDPAYSKPLGVIELQRLQREQFNAWCFLQVRLREWNRLTAPFRSRLWKLDSALRENWTFLKSKYEHVKPRLATLKASGASLGRCRACKYPAAEKRSTAKPLEEATCLVCERTQSCLHLQCPECEEPVIVSEYCEGQCGCGEFSPDIDWVLAQLSVAGLESPTDSGDGVYCVECYHSGTATVVEFGDGYLCASCLTRHDSMGSCDYCSAQFVGANLEDSYVFGCEMCDGRAGQDNS